MTAHFISSGIYRQTGYSSNHPLGIARIGPVLTLCQQLGWLAASGPGAFIDSPMASLSELTRFHEPDYVLALKKAETTGPVPPHLREKYRFGTMENPIFKGLFRRAGTTVGGSILAARLAAKGGVAYHPSGGTHHAMRGHAAGFCYFNDPVFAILTFLESGFGRVLYVDLDAHHGDGVEAAFAGEDRVFTISVHEENRWPYSGGVDDRSTGNARNLPVPAGFNDTEMDWLMEHCILPLARRFQPQAVVVTGGADALQGDPLSKLALSNKCLWDAVMKLTHLSGSTVVLGGGGYNPWTVARCWAGLWANLSGHDIPASLPPESVALLEGLSCDLVDDEDRLPGWTGSIVDPRNDGPVAERIKQIGRLVLEPS